MLKVDLHVHTVKSDCGFCTLNEMAEEAVKRGVKVLGIADHGPMINVSDTYFKAHFIIPKYFGKTRVLFGGEFNIINKKGELDLSEEFQQRLDFVIAGIHNIGQDFKNSEKNTISMINALKNPNVKIISHPTLIGKYPLDVKKVTEAACKYNKLMELNASYLNFKRKLSVYPIKAAKEMIKIIKDNGHKLIINSDAHHTSEIADDTPVMKYKDELGLTDDIIINNDMKALKKYFPI